MNKSTTIKISEETKNFLDKLKATEGIEIKFAVDKAVKEYYGKKNSN